VKFLLDQDVYAITARLLQSLGHEVATAYEAGLSQADDMVLLEEAKRRNCIMVTRDRDYGGLVFVRRQANAVIYLRVTPATVAAVHAELERVLRSYPETELRHAFVVVEPGRHRLRRLPT
jgi:predicted nuclease of predicted toxin-antitoxin system